MLQENVHQSTERFLPIGCQNWSAWYGAVSELTQLVVHYFITVSARNLGLTVGPYGSLTIKAWTSTRGTSKHKWIFHHRRSVSHTAARSMSITRLPKLPLSGLKFRLSIFYVSLVMVIVSRVGLCDMMIYCISSDDWKCLLFRIMLYCLLRYIIWWCLSKEALVVHKLHEGWQCNKHSEALKTHRRGASSTRCLYQPA